MDRQQLKSTAKQQIKGKIGILFLISLIIGLISTLASLVLSLIPFGGLISSVFLSPAFSLSLVMVYLNLSNGASPAVDNTFWGFSDFWSAFKVQFLVGLFTFLWSLLLVVPGIIKSLSYSMAMYDLAENNGKPALACIDASRKLTEGHKMDLFVLGLSFFGWILLGVVTCGLAFIWVGPYMQTTYANTYNALKKNSL